MAAKQHAAQGNWQDQAVECASQDDHALCTTKNCHNERGEGDKADDEPLVILGDEGVNSLEEGDRGIGRANDGGDTGREQCETEETVADVAGSKAESLGCGVGSAGDGRDIFRHDDRTGRADAEHTQEQQNTNAARDADAGQDGLAEVLDFLRLAAPARIEQLVCAGEGDVTAAGAAEQRDHDGNEFLGILRGKDMGDRIADGGLCHESHDQHNDDNNAAEDLGDPSDDVVCLLGKENADSKHAADDDTGLFGNADHGIEAE